MRQATVHPFVTEDLERPNSGERATVIQERTRRHAARLEHEDPVSVLQVEAGESVDDARLSADARAVLLKPIRPDDFKVAEVLREILSESAREVHPCTPA
jgi:hypothetical protein